MDVEEEKKLPYGSNITKTTINHPRINGLLGINENGNSTDKKTDKCHRFSLKLFLSDDKDFPEFDYISLLKQMGLGSSGDGTVIGDSSLFEDDADNLKALAQKFEEKYAPKKKESYKRLKNEFVDVGFGYDESDTFIDNTEAYDECVPSDWTTEHGGFYINQGNLDFRPCERNSGDATKKEQAAFKKKKKKALIDGKTSQKTPKELSTQKKKKHLLHKEKQRKRQESLQKATKILAKKKRAPVFIDESSQDIPLAQLNKSLEKEKVAEKDKQPGSSHVAIDTSFEDNIPLAKIAKSSPAVNSSSKAIVVDSTPTPKSNTITVSTCFSKGSTSPLNTVLVKSGSGSSPLAVATKNGISEGEVKAKVETPLPEGLAKELLDDIETLKGFAVNYVKGKGFFTAEVNKVMLSFARTCRLLSPKIRNAVYDHMLCFLPCARDTLVKRCRRLIVQHQREMEDEPIRILKEAIDSSMLEQKKEYDEEVADALQEQAREQIKQTGVDPMRTENQEDNETNDGDEKKSTDDAKKYFPKKKYSWTDELRKLLCDVVKVRVGLFKMSKSKSMTAEEYIKDFLESEIRKLWPKGWMTSRILYKESRIAHQEITQPGKGKKPFTKLPCGYSIANLTVGESTSSPPPYILKSGPKTPISTAANVETPNSTPISSNSPLNTPVSTKTTLCNPEGIVKNVVGIPVSKLKSPNTSDVITPSVTMSSQIVCNGMTGSVSKQTQPCTIKTVVPKSLIKSALPAANSKIVAASMNTANLLTISKSTSNAFSSIIVSNSSSYTLSKASTVVTWNTSSLVTTPSSFAGKSLSAVVVNKLPTNLKLANSAKTKTHAQVNAKFVETIEKTSFLKPEPLDEPILIKESNNRIHDSVRIHDSDRIHDPTRINEPSNIRKQVGINKGDAHLRNVETSEKKLFYSNPSSSSSPIASFNRNKIQSRTSETSHYAISPTFIHTTKTVHNDQMANEMYYRQQQVKRKLPIEISDNRNNTKRNIPDSILITHSKSMENKSWSEVENELVRLSQEEITRKIKEESPSPPPRITSVKSPDHALKGKEWCHSSTSHIVHLSQVKSGSQASRPLIDNVVKTIVNRSPNSTRAIEPPKFDTNALRKTIAVVPSQNKYVLTSKQLSPQLYQQTPVPTYTNRKGTQLSINNSSSKSNSMNSNHQEYPAPRHPSSRIQMKSDHQYSSNFENNGRLLNDPHSSIQNSHNALQTSHSSMKTSHNSLHNSHKPSQSSHKTLQSSHSSLHSSHNSLQSSHSSLQSNHSSLKSTHCSLQSNHGSLQSMHNSSDNQAKLRLTTHTSPQQKQHLQQQQQQLSMHGILMPGKYIGVQQTNQSMTSQMNQARLLEEQMKSHQKDGRNVRRPRTIDTRNV